MSESARPFVHLHCHSHYSLLDGASEIGTLVKRAKELGMNGLALTDHGNLHGALEFYKKAKDAGINPILGYEAYIAPGSRYEKKDAANSKEASYHLTLLAQNRTGFKNLVKLASAASLEGFYYKPRIDKELLARHHEGIICLSGCVSSELSHALIKGGADVEDFREAREIAAWFHKLFGERYFIEIMNNGVEVQRLQLAAAVDMANQLGIPLVATSDAHYVNRDDAVAQDVMLCINTGKFRTDSNRMKMENDEFYLRSPDEMYAHFPNLEDAVARSQEIANSVAIDLELGQRHFPVFQLPENKTTEDYLRELCVTGLKERYAGDEEMLPGGELAQVVQERLDRELSVINQLGFPNYFLIVWDFVRHARDQGVPATARGSGVGAIVCYALYLSHVCPIRYDLLFERFLDLNRKEAPDIDIDFCKDRRGEIIRYVKEKYGEENVAQIGTFGTLAAKAAITDVGRVLGWPVARVNQLKSLVPEQLGISLDEALENSEELKKLYDADAESREVLDLARKIEGLARNVGTHAAAVVIADKPLTEYVPLCRVKDKTDIITQWSMGDVEAAGLLKMDFLGLRNLTILTKAVDLIEQTTGQRVDPYTFPLDDKKTFALLQRGETKGIFQLESGGIRDLLQKMKPDHFSDIIATNALYRPGPLEGGMVQEYVDVKHGRKAPEYVHPVCERILSETNGVMVYQEQVMRILNELGGIELASAYTCIKAISKKKEELIAKNREQFLKGAQEKGLSQQQAEDFWNLIIKFAGYGFNKCVVGDTQIVEATTGERTSVADLFANRRPWSIHALNEQGKLVARRVVDVVWNGRKRVYRLTTSRGLTISATANHPFRTQDGWTMLGQLRPGDCIAAVDDAEPWRRMDASMGESFRTGSSSLLKNCMEHEWSPAPAAWPPFNREEESVLPFDSSSNAAVLALPEPAIVWDAIAAIEPAGVEDTYDLTVEHDHNFVAEGLVVHNSHSTAYALIAYMTAYLKAHYPVEFMAALLSGDIPGRNFQRKDALVEHLEDCERMGIVVEPPDVNRSHVDFAVHSGKIQFGLAAIKGCGGASGEAIVAARNSGGPFKDLYDFCERVDASGASRATIETLNKAGAFDFLGVKRAQLHAIIDRAVQAGQSLAADKKSGQKSLFGDDSADTKPAASLPNLDEWPDRERAQNEKEVLGYYLTSHPLDEHKLTLSKYCSHTTADIAQLKDREEVVLGGMISSLKFSQTRNPQPGKPSKYVMFDLEDVAGAVRCILWPDGFAEMGQLVVPDAILVARGAIDRRGGDEANLIINELIPLDELGQRYTTGIVLRILESEHPADILEKIREVVRASPGNSELQFALVLEDGSRVFLRSNRIRVEITRELQDRLEGVLGSGNLQLITTKPRTQSPGPAPRRGQFQRAGSR